MAGQQNRAAVRKVDARLQRPDVLGFEVRAGDVVQEQAGLEERVLENLSYCCELVRFPSPWASFGSGAVGIHIHPISDIRFIFVEYNCLPFCPC